MDTDEVEARLREDAARFHDEVSQIDVDALEARVLAALGLRQQQGEDR